jgi:hypothetical protein
MSARTTRLGYRWALLACTAFIWNHAIAACEDAAYRNFDFWIGEWEVRTPDGQLAGINRITREYGGCVIHERYSSGRGYSGESLNMYDAGRRRWQQTWVDNQGMLLLLEGQFADDRMVLEGETLDKKGTATKHRITWTRNADGTVRQLWEVTDAKGAWTTAFDGRYARKRATGE